VLDHRRTGAGHGRRARWPGHRRRDVLRPAHTPGPERLSGPLDRVPGMSRQPDDARDRSDVPCPGRSAAARGVPRVLGVVARPVEPVDTGRASTAARLVGGSGAKMKASVPAPVSKVDKTRNSSSQTHETNSAAALDPPVDKILFLQRTVGNHEVEKLVKSGVGSPSTRARPGPQVNRRSTNQRMSGKRIGLPIWCGPRRLVLWLAVHHPHTTTAVAPSRAIAWAGECGARQCGPSRCQCRQAARASATAWHGARV
jgi:hypothetical protein